MIARSDLFILVVSASLLAAGILRWQNNMSTSTIAVSTTPPVRVAATPGSVAASNANSGTVAAATAQGSSAVFTSAQIPQIAADRAQLAADQVQPAQQQISNEVSTSSRRLNADTGFESTGTDTPVSGPLYGTYIVQPGDFLGRIAQNYGTSVATLRQINGISGSLIEVGQEIKYPLPAN